MDSQTGTDMKPGKVLYGEETKHTLDNMSFSGVALSRFPVYIKNAAGVKKACAIANERAGLLSADKAKAIIAACDRVMEGDYADAFPVDVYHGGGGIGINMNINEVLSSLAGEGVNPVDDINLSQSTSDVCHTALRITLRQMLAELDVSILEAAEILLQKAAAFRDISTIARTCWQDGLEIPASALFEGTASALKRQSAGLKEWKDRLRHVNLGWTVVGTGSGATAEYRQKILPSLREVFGEDLVWRASSYDAAEYPDDLAGVSGLVNRTGQILAKLARDLRILSSGPETGLMELVVPPVQKGSSFFPGKVNPVMAEMMVQCSMLVYGHDCVIQNALGLGEIHLNVWEEMMGFLLMDSIGMMTKSVSLFTEKCLAGIEINNAVCESYASARIPLVTSFKDRYGYKYLSDWVKREGYDAVAEALKRERQNN